MNEQDYNKALDAWEALLARQYIEQAGKMVGDVTLAEVLALIKAGDDLLLVQMLEGAATYAAMVETGRSAYIAGGTDEIAGLSGAAVQRIKAATGYRPQFDPRRQSAEDFLRSFARDTVQGIARNQGEAVQLIVAAGRASGDTPQQIAQSVLGVKSPITGQRSGGVIGLAGNDAQAIANARAQLSSGNPSEVMKYFQRVRRDRRFDGTILKALKTGQALDRATIDKIVARYSERLLQTRAEAEASIQAVETYNAGRAQLYKQLVQDGIDPTTITKQWRTRGDERVRVSHKAMSGQTQYADVPFNAPGGVKMMHPGDSSLGAGPSLIARCRCRAIFTISPRTSE